MSLLKSALLPSFISFLERHGLIRREDLMREDERGFLSRLKLQKLVFLARYFGLDMGYSFSLYIHGPYSPDLARDYYSLAAAPPAEGPVNLPGAFRREEFLSFVSAPGRDEEWLEAAATAADLAEVWSLEGEGSVRELTEHLKKMKPHVARHAEGAVRETLKIVGAGARAK
ncbi:MAG: hypothetical protein H5T34_01600 [Candidatus Methanomethyliales bacterium]|nr:hypothetical protein [Candidatus Methanomethylicales archaeon]